jgi:hypothetical protein
MLKLFIQQGQNYTAPIFYTWIIFAQNKSLKFQLVNERSIADICIDSDTGDFVISSLFHSNLKNGTTSHTEIFLKDCLIRNEKGEEDLFSTCFYMLNSVQEYGCRDLDEVGRFKYSNSYQSKFNNTSENLVQSYFNKIASHPKILPFVKSQKIPSRIFLSHDIDSIEGALLQDGLYLLKKGRWLEVMPIFFNYLMRKPDWLNMDLVMNIEDEYSFKSAFFWIVNQGRINKRLVNADYPINSKMIKNQLHKINVRGFENGLHKSVAASDFKDEIDKLGFNPGGNRYHYLRMQLPKAYDTIQESGIPVDCSLGFAERYGFRNSYGLPFQPYNFHTESAYDFVEVPLNIMDGTFQRYMKIPLEETLNLIIEFIELNKTDCLLSVLWHNTFFTNYKYGGYLQVYKNLLRYFYDNKFACVNLSHIAKEYQEKRI